MKTILVDSSAILFPLIYNASGYELTTDKGVVVTCVYSFLEELLNLGLEFSSNRFIILFDSRESLRRAIYPEYKLNRQEVSDEIKEKRISLYSQIPLLRDFLTGMGIPCISEEGFEADDLIASFVLNNPSMDFVTVSSDHDMLQLIRENNIIYNPRKGRYVDASVFQEQFPHLSPKEYWRILSLAGCSTDNVPPCIKGVGERTAYQYLQGTLKESSKAYQKIQEGLINTPLIESLTHLPLNTTPIYRVPSIHLKFSSFLELSTEYQFQSFLNSLLPKWSLWFNMR